MNILFVTPRLPYPLLKGDRLRAFHMIRRLHGRGHRISLLSFIEDEAERRWRPRLMEYCERVDMVLLPRWRSYLNMLIGVFSGTPFQIAFYRSKKISDALREMSAGGGCDVVHFIFSRMMPYARAVEGVPAVMDHVDAYSMNMERRFRLERGVRKAAFFYEWKRLRQYERSHHGLFSYSVVASRVDREYLGGGRIDIVPNGVDLKRFAPPSTGTAGRDIDLIFAGNMGYFPNKDAALYFCKDVFPLILQRRPGTTFYVVGADPPPAVRGLADGKNVFVTGYVDNMQDYLARALVSVCPIRSGSGIQNKVLEAMASGVAVAATSCAIGGIAARDGREALISDEPEAFAANVLRLLEDGGLRGTLALNGRRMVEQGYSWDASAARFEGVYARAREAFINAAGALPQGLPHGARQGADG